MYKTGSNSTQRLPSSVFSTVGFRLSIEKTFSEFGAKDLISRGNVNELHSPWLSTMHVFLKRKIVFSVNCTFILVPCNKHVCVLFVVRVMQKCTFPKPPAESKNVFDNPNDATEFVNLLVVF